MGHGYKLCGGFILVDQHSFLSNAAIIFYMDDAGCCEKVCSFITVAGFVMCVAAKLCVGDTSEHWSLYKEGEEHQNILGNTYDIRLEYW